MTEFNKEYKELYNSYNKKLLAEHKLNFSALDTSLTTIVEQINSSSFLKCNNLYDVGSFVPLRR